MKHAITLTVLLLVAMVAFGQATDQRLIKISEKSRMERRPEAVKKRHHETGQRHRLEKYNCLLQEHAVKSAQVIKLRLDSTVFEYWDEDAEQWVYDWRQEYFYSNGFISSYNDYWWNDTTSLWIPQWRDEYTYGASGNMTEAIFYEWDEVAVDWVSAEKMEFSYDANENLAVTIYYEWDADAGEWVPSWKEEYFYDANGNEIEYLGYEWDGDSSEWSVYEKWESTYDEDENLIQVLALVWDSDASDWVADWKEEASYDEHGNMTLYTEYVWDTDAGDWVVDWTYKTEYTYDASERIILTIEYSWDEDAGEWYADYRADYTYDANGNPNMEFYAVLDEGTGEMISTMKYEYTYDLSHDFDELIAPGGKCWFWPDMCFAIQNQPLAVSYYWWDYDLEDWLDYGRGNYYYSEQEVVYVNNMEQPIAEIYPNPVAEYIVFSFSGDHQLGFFELYDLQGRLMLTEEIGPSERLSLEGLSSGMYLYNLYMDGMLQSGKLIKE
jgi:hypothetical protein